MKRLFNSRISKSQVIKFQTVVDLREFVAGETHSPVPTGSENSAVLLALSLRWSFKVDNINFNFT